MPSFTVFKGSKSGEIHSETTERPNLSRNQVLVKVTASGVCGTDLHYRKAGIALGHEGVGVVEEVGPEVKKLKKGDRVGWGYMHDSCGTCRYCLSGNETYCPERELYGENNKDQGSFGTQAVWNEHYLFPIPEGMSDETAAPLMCGGATVFNALHKYGVSPTDRVGVIGIGGLGHLAIQYASKMGCDVVVFSGSESKKEEAKKLGASSFYAMKDKKPGEVKIGRPVDALLLTAAAMPDWNLYLPLLASQATIFPLTAGEGDVSIPLMALNLRGLTIQGSVVAARHIHQRMLDFSAHHQIKPIIEKFPMTVEGVTEACDKLEKGNVRYRGVLINEQGPKSHI